jgi:hypothetical protein
MSKVKIEPDFERLWKIATTSIQDERFKSALTNHSESKEKICRKLGIVSEPDVFRIINQLRIRPSRKRIDTRVESRRRREPENVKENPKETRSTKRIT